MNYLHPDILLRLIAAHVIADFIIQPASWVADRMKNRIRSKYLYYHTLITGILTFIAFGNGGAVMAALIITISHFLLDVTKSYLKKDSTPVFIIDQALHLLVILICWLGYTGQFHTLGENLVSRYYDVRTIAVITAYIIITLPLSIIISRLTKKWYTDVYGKHGNDDDSLENAGKWIGIIERLLVLTFSIMGRFDAIGFLLAAKSVFRFNDLKNGCDRKRTEYVLIGTFISFASAIAIGLAIRLSFMP